MPSILDSIIDVTMSFSLVFLRKYQTYFCILCCPFPHIVEQLENILVPLPIEVVFDLRCLLDVYLSHSGPGRRTHDKAHYSTLYGGLTLLHHLNGVLSKVNKTYIDISNGQKFEQFESLKKLTEIVSSAVYWNWYLSLVLIIPANSNEDGKADGVVSLTWTTLLNWCTFLYKTYAFQALIARSKPTTVPLTFAWMEAFASAIIWVLPANVLQATG